MRLATWYFLFIGALGALAPYLAICLQNAGASGMATGIVLAIIPIGLLLGSPLGTLLADRSGKPIWVLRLCIAISATATLGLYLAPDWRFMAPAAALLALARAPAGAITDNIAVQMTSGGNYGRVRLWGSVGFVLICWGVGWNLDSWPDAPILCCLGLLILLMFATERLKTGSLKHEQSTSSISALLSRPQLTALYSVAILHSATVAVYDRFFALHVTSIGLPSKVAANALALGVTVEVGVMAAAPFLLRKLGAMKLILLAVAVGIPRWWLCGVVEDSTTLILIQALHGLSFGAWWIGGIALVAEQAPPGLRNSAQGMFLAAGHGLGQLLAMVGAALALDRLSTGEIFEALSVVSLLAFALAILWLARAPSRTAPSTTSPVNHDDDSV